MCYGFNCTLVTGDVGTDGDTTSDAAHSAHGLLEFTVRQGECVLGLNH